MSRRKQAKWVDKERGYESLGTTQIPFVQRRVAKNWTIRYYGGHDMFDASVSFLIWTKHQEKISWRATLHTPYKHLGEASNKLQTLFKTEDGKALFSEVLHFRRNKSQPISGTLLGMHIEEALRGDLQSWADIKACIEAAALAEKRKTLIQEVVCAIEQAAKRLNRVPLHSEVRETLWKNLANEGRDITEGDFSRYLKKAGYAWLPKRTKLEKG